MNAIYLGGNAVTVLFPLVNDSGEAILATSIEYRVLRGDGTEVVAKTAAATYVANDPEVQIVVPAEANELTAPSTREVRVVEVFATTESGVVMLDTHYLIEADQPLVVDLNSYQTYAGALQTSWDIPSLEGWNNATKRDRIAALISAWRSIERINFKNTDEPAFAEARVRAQVMEANYLLGGDEVGDIRKSGLMSMTVGEAKQFYRPGKPLESVVCKRALKELSRWIDTRVSLVRV